MTDDRKTSEELIREARSRLSSSGSTASSPETPAEEEARPQIDDAESAVEKPSSPYEHDGADEPATPPTDAVAAARAAKPTIPPADSPVEEPWPPNPLESGNRRRSLLTSRWFRLAVLVAIGLGYGFFTSLNDADRDSSGEIVASGDLDVMKVQAGDCFDDPSGDEEVVFELQAIPCSEPHDNEVFAVESVAGLFGSDYPGRQALEEHAYEVCSGPVFDSYVGIPYLDSSLEVFSLTPTDDSWSQGDRDVVCVLYKLDYTKLNGPARNSGL